MAFLADLWRQLGYQIIFACTLFLWHRWQHRYLKKKNSLRDFRITQLERLLNPMHITQVPAKPSHWGLMSLIPGVPGRLGQKVNKIVIHWMDTNMAEADRVFQGLTKPERVVSAHFGVEDDQIHQYVSIGNTAWHAGNWLVNLQSIGIEHSAQPGRDASDATYDTSAQLICDLCRQLGLVPSRSLLHKHSEFKNTSCPGNIDLDRLAALVVEKWNTPIITLTDAPVIPQEPQVHSDTSNTTVTFVQPFTVTVSVPLARFRNKPSLDSFIMAKYPRGTTIACIQQVEGESVLGNTTWYKSLNHGWYISASVATRN